ncbi:MAG: hypothetical protein CMQ46_08745 [Gammaproteobacteria bacterium]|nr:hypothetical protein [Gammaproteobacteria bacterium]MBJ55334.1 hypothetical protein [Gammaproteobacteria bacterium]|tara:strand:- start:266 stop:982 length:717 start_codon:yes stop_codon:yes gene_type:complete
MAQDKKSENSGAGNAASENLSSDRETNTLMLDSFKLAPGDMIQIQTLGVGKPERYQAKVIGIHAPLSVMAATPKSNGKLLFFREGQQVLVRCFIGRDAVAYRSQILKSNLSPFAYLHLAYPESVQSMRIRESARVAVDIVATIETNAGKHSARIVDLSSGGARLLCRHDALALEDEIKIAFRITPSDMDVLMKIKAIVRAINVGEADTAYGVQFVDLRQKEKLYLTNMVYQNLLKDNL